MPTSPMGLTGNKITFILRIYHAGLITLAAAAAAMSAKVFLKRKKDDEIDELEEQITTSTSSLPSQVIPQVNVSR
jgi:hypothetical protein